MDNHQGGATPQGGDDNKQGNNYEYGHNAGGSQPYYNPYLDNQQNQQPQQGPQTPQAPQGQVPNNPPTPPISNPYLNQQAPAQGTDAPTQQIPPQSPPVPPQPTQPLQQPMGAPTGPTNSYAGQQAQQPPQQPGQPGGQQFYQYPQNNYGAGYPNQPGPGQMTGQPMPQPTPQRKSGAGVVIAIVAVVLLVAALGIVFLARGFSSLMASDTTTTQRTYPSSRVLPSSPSMLVPSAPPSRAAAPTRGATSPTAIADEVRADVPASVAALVIGQTCEEDVFPLDDVTPEKLCQLNTNTDSEYTNYLGVVKDRSVIADVRQYGDFEQWKSIESAPGHTLKLGFTGPQEDVGESTVFFDFVNGDTLVTYRMLGTEDAVSQYLVDLGLAQFRDKA